MPDLSTTYLGLELKSPLVASASALSKKLENIARMEEAGLGAVVLYSLFEEELMHESLALNYYLERGTETYSEALTYFPDLQNYSMGPEKYFELIQKAKKRVSFPVIASLNGMNRGGWIDSALQIEQAGADALELNLYYLPTSINLRSEDLENEQIALVRELRSKMRIPLAVKLSPYYSALPSFTARLVEAGANGLVLFNRFYQPDLDIEALEVKPSLVLSTEADLQLPLRWTAILYGRVEADLALTSGVHTGQNAIKAIMAGAAVAMSASELIANGIGRSAEILTEIQAWMENHEYTSVRQMRGSMSQRSVAEPGAFERANYMKALTLYDNRI